MNNGSDTINNIFIRSTKIKEDIKMTITDIKIRKIIPDGRLRAVISITVDDQIAIHDIKVVQGDARLFVAMPSRKDENGVFRDIVHPISPDARQSIESQILDAYTRHIEMDCLASGEIG